MIGSTNRNDVNGSIALSDSGQALAVWGSQFEAPVAATWNRSDINGTWSTAQPDRLLANFVLRGAIDGSAVLHDDSGEVRRFLPATNAWIEVASMGNGVGTLALFGRNSDPLVYDGMLPALAFSQNSSKILSQAGNAGWSTRYDLTNFSTLLPRIAGTRESIGAGTPNGQAVAINERGDAIAMYSDAGNIYAIRF